MTTLYHILKEKNPQVLQDLYDYNLQKHGVKLVEPPDDFKNTYHYDPFKGFDTEEADPVDDTDKLVCIYFNGKKIASLHKSKLNINPRGAFVIQQSCENYWNSQLRYIINES